MSWINALTDADSGNIVLKHITCSYSEYMEKKFPAAIERGIYGKDTARRQGEGMLPYCIRRDKLSKEGWPIPDEAKGYIYIYMYCFGMLN